ncbi:MAG TPA: hypothetical protein VKH35_11070 [Thermoanaerobaculia bacterium]|nr:hypothetical protein [Thermoanaerobaculia bacterium]
MKHFVEWDQLEVRVNGDKLNAFAQSFRVPPLDRLHLHFQNGALRVIGSVRTFISVPFEVEIREIVAAGRSVRIPLRSLSAFGGIPIPRFLFSLVKDRFPAEFVRYEEPATLVIALDRFLPNFVQAEIQRVWIIDGGLAVTLGRGGADLPAPRETTTNGADRT